MIPDARQRYYAAQRACIDVGGSWMPPTGSSDNYNAHCIRFAR